MAPLEVTNDLMASDGINVAGQYVGVDPEADSMDKASCCLTRFYCTQGKCIQSDEGSEAGVSDIEEKVIRSRVVQVSKVNRCWLTCRWEAGSFGNGSRVSVWQYGGVYDSVEIQESRSEGRQVSQRSSNVFPREGFANRTEGCYQVWPAHFSRGTSCRHTRS